MQIKTKKDESAVELANNAPITKDLVAHAKIAILFPAFNDGRGFSLAKRLRRLGFKGELIARGHLIPDQYDYAVKQGFSTIEIDETRAARQTLNQWETAAKSLSHNYQNDIFALRHKQI